MAVDDHAVVIGISRYPHLKDLGGPEHDADAVIEWLRDPEGGDVPEEQIHKVTSTCFPEPPRPGSDDVYNAFRPVVELRAPSDRHPVGRRLYIFMAGHGFGPELDEASLLMANAAYHSYRHNVSGVKLANHFGKARYFREIVLLMDCCRESLEGIPAGLLPWDPVHGNGDSPRRLYGYAVRDSHRVRERTHEGRKRGIFTVALIEALRAGVRSSSELRDRVRRRMIELMDHDEYETPEFFIGEDEISFVAPATRLVTLTVTLTRAERPVCVAIATGPGMKPFAQTTLRAGESAAFELSPGLYEVRRDDGGEPAKVSIDMKDTDVPL